MLCINGKGKSWGSCLKMTRALNSVFSAFRIAKKRRSTEKVRSTKARTKEHSNPIEGAREDIKGLWIEYRFDFRSRPSLLMFTLRSSFQTKRWKASHTENKQKFPHWVDDYKIFERNDVFYANLWRGKFRMKEFYRIGQRGKIEFAGMSGACKIRLLTRILARLSGYPVFVYRKSGTE